MEIYTKQIGRLVLSTHWADEDLWTVEEPDSIAKQTLLVAISLISPANKGRPKGFQLVVGKLLIAIGWLVEDPEVSAEARHEL
jgi:hypothetical protein